MRAPPPSLRSRESRARRETSGRLAAGRHGGGVARHAGGDQEGTGETDRPREDVPAAAPRLHHQQRAAPPHGRVLPRQRALQRAADLHVDGRDSEGAHQPGEGGVPRSAEEGHALQFCDCFYRSQATRLQGEGDRQYHVGQEGHRRFYDVAVPEVPDRGLPGYSHHASQPRAAALQPHAALLSAVLCRRLLCLLLLAVLKQAFFLSPLLQSENT